MHHVVAGNLSLWKVVPFRARSPLGLQEALAQEKKYRAVLTEQQIAGLPLQIALQQKCPGVTLTQHVLQSCGTTLLKLDKRIVWLLAKTLGSSIEETQSREKLWAEVAAKHAYKEGMEDDEAHHLVLESTKLFTLRASYFFCLKISATSI